MGIARCVACVTCCVALAGLARQVNVDWSPYTFTLNEFEPDAQRTVSIADYGAKPDGTLSTDAINRAVEDCSAKGGGRVLVPPGVWATGALVLRSGVELHLAADAVLAFAEGPDEYPLLPSPKGYDERDGKRPAPFIRADGATNVAITGYGELRGNVKHWFSKGVLGRKSRPGFIWLESCRNILLRDVKIRQSAFWTIHTRLCTDIVLRGLDVKCERDIATTYTNTDGVDIDSCSRVLIEDCRFSQDDDVICMKSGKNETGRKLGMPTEFVAVRRCTAENGHGLLAIGSELSGGIRNIYMTDCHVDGMVDFFLRIKTNRARGGYARDITIENISGVYLQHEAVRIETDYPEWGGVKKPYYFTEIENVTVRNLRCAAACYGISLNGFQEHPARNVRVEDVAVERTLKGLVAVTNNIEGLVVEGLRQAPAGWVDIGNDRRAMPPRRRLWNAPEGRDAFVVDMRDGAEGRVAVSNGAITVVKENDRGVIVVKPREPFKVERGRQVRASARVSCTNAEPLRSIGDLKMFGPKEDFGPTGLDRMNFGSYGPRVGTLVNTPPGATETKFAHYQAWGHDGVATPAIVVGGARSESTWTDWLIEDMPDVRKAWEREQNRRKARDRSDEAMPDEDFERELAAEADHCAKVELRNGEPVLLVDGEVSPPVMFKSRTLGFKYDRGRYVYTGRRMERDAGIDIHVVNLPYARTHNYTNGVWTKDGYDAKAAVDSIRLAMRIAPKAKFILSLPMMHYVEFGERHPDEVARTKDGRIMYGNESVVYGNAEDFSGIPSNRWAWASYSSDSLLREGSEAISSLVAELKRTGMSKRVIGFHLCGFSDGQFGTPGEIDFSPVARKAYQKRGGGMDYVEFIQREPTRLQNEFARRLKAEMGKDIVVMRWCFSAFSGGYTGSYDIGEFLNSDSLDILVAQPMYINRAPGVPLGLRLPLASFRRHGKMFMNEFDLRTDLSLGCCGSIEADAVGMGLAKGFDMWQSVFRRAAGQMMANGSGWWFFDMAGGWYEGARIAADIASANATYRNLLSHRGTMHPNLAWRPDVAVLVDEQAALSLIAEKGSGRDFNKYHVVLASSGVPYDQYLAADALADPSLLDRYRLVIWYGLRKDACDPRRGGLISMLTSKGASIIRHEELLGLSGRDLFERARAAGAYVPCETYGLQVDMNGSFISVHALKPGSYRFRLPVAVDRVRNIKTGLREKTPRGMLDLTMDAGETRWYALWNTK